MYKKHTITVLVPAYNEEKRIVNVLSLLKQCDFLDEIIVINDGSTDQTLSLIDKLEHIKIINLKRNHGKGFAIATGIKKAKNEIILFIDADLLNLKVFHVEKLVKSIIYGRYQASVGYPIYYNIDHLLKPISGERAYFRKDLMPYLKEIKRKGYGLELYLNYIFKNRRTKIFPLKGVKNILKHNKQSLDVAAKLFLIEIIDIFGEISKQKNPFLFLNKSYLESFYFNKSNNEKKLNVNKFFRDIKKYFLKIIE
jgi:polyisoprenyl-phosphate glycosyltransferase